MTTRGSRRPRAVVLCPFGRFRPPGGRGPEARLAEAAGLAEAIDLEIVARETVPVRGIRAGSFFGRGAVARLGELARTLEADLACVDGALSPAQQRALETAWKTKVIDRTGLILEIFGARARTREGVLQVELAHLTYQRGRLVRSWTHLERQRGGLGFLGGPGETQIEADRRALSDRIAKIGRELEAVKRTRALHRAARRRAAFPVVALVGYTNAGKSALFNRLAASAVPARDMLFATLDPAMRAVRLPSGRPAMLVDTVGFVSDLPTALVAAFRATLEEVVAADVVVHVRDAAHPDGDSQKEDVLAVLAQLGAAPGRGRVFCEVLNKIDLLAEREREAVLARAGRCRDAVALSALTGENCAGLLALLDRLAAGARGVARLRLRPDDGAAISWLYRNAEVVGRSDGDAHVDMEVAISADGLARFEKLRLRGRAAPP